jgi:hypothetical protein
METLFDISTKWPLYKTLTAELSLVVLFLFIAFILKRESNRFYFVGLILAVFPLTFLSFFIYFYVTDTNKLNIGEYLFAEGKVYSFESDGLNRISFMVNGKRFSCSNNTYWIVPKFKACEKLTSYEHVKVLYVPDGKHAVSPPKNLVLKLMYDN